MCYIRFVGTMMQSGLLCGTERRNGSNHQQIYQTQSQLNEGQKERNS
jgi:hypothetical protein